MAVVYTMNASDVKRMQLLVELPPLDPDPNVISGDGAEKKGQADTPPKQVDLSQANIGKSAQASDNTWIAQQCPTEYVKVRAKNDIARHLGTFRR